MNIRTAMDWLNEGHTLTRKKWRRGRVIVKRMTAPKDEPLIMQSWNSTVDDLTANDWELTSKSVPNPYRRLHQRKREKV